MMWTCAQEHLYPCRPHRYFLVLRQKACTATRTSGARVKGTELEDSRVIWRNDSNILLDNPLNPIQPHLQRLHLGPITQPDKVVTRRVKEIPSFRGIEIEEDSRHDNDLFCEARLEKVQPVTDSFRKATCIEPDIERAIWHMLWFEDEANLAEPGDDKVALLLEVLLQSNHLFLNVWRFKHGDGGFLERYCGATIEIGAAGANGLDKFLGTNDPCDPPSRKAEALG